MPMVPQSQTPMKRELLPRRLKVIGFSCGSKPHNQTSHQLRGIFESFFLQQIIALFEILYALALLQLPEFLGQRAKANEIWLAVCWLFL